MTDVVLRDEEARIEEGLEEVDGGWRKIADALRRIREAKAWKQEEYATYQAYYNAKWEERMGVAFNDTRKWIRGLEVYEQLQSISPEIVPPQGYQAAAALSSIPKEERPEFWEKGVLSDKPSGNIETGEIHKRVTRYKEVKQEKAGDKLTPEDWASLPSPELSKEEKFALLYPAKAKAAIAKLDPEEVANAAVTIQRRPNDLSREAETVREVIDWFTRYEEALNKRLRKGIHVVDSNVG